MNRYKWACHFLSTDFSVNKETILKGEIGLFPNIWVYEVTHMVWNVKENPSMITKILAKQSYTR